jgi:transketolase
MILMMNGLDGIIRQLEAQRTAIERALQALREVGGEVSGGSAPLDPSLTTVIDKRSAGQKARWAKKHAAAQAKKRPGRPAKVA